MTIIVEDGTAKIDAETFASVAAADTYHSVRGNTTWADLATAAKEQALRKATDYMGQCYASAWKGFRVTTTQALDWPRTMVPKPGTYGDTYYAITDMPVAVVNACCELALRASSATLAADQSQALASVKAGSVEVAYAPNSSARKTYPAVTRLLAPYIIGGGGASYVSLSKS